MNIKEKRRDVIKNMLSKTIRMPGKKFKRLGRKLELGMCVRMKHAVQDQYFIVTDITISIVSMSGFGMCTEIDLKNTDIFRSKKYKIGYVDNALIKYIIHGS